MTEKVLILIHTQGALLPGVSFNEPNNGHPLWSTADFLRLQVGDPATGRAGSNLQGLKQALLLDPALPAQLYLPVPPHEVNIFMQGQMPPSLAYTRQLIEQHAAAFGLANAGRALALWDDAYLDTWDGLDPQTLSTQIEASRAVAYAVEHGFTALMPVSVGYGHAARCGLIDFTAAEPHGLTVFGYSRQSFPGLSGEQSVVLDPPFKSQSPVARVPANHHFHTLVPQLFVACTKHPDATAAIAADLAAVLKKYGVTTNSKGAAL